ncbi:TraB/GumN family protein [Ferrimonas gelatinilytica]|uniref:TraB/GumN family protein n=1 Tax=Ferrimonas gelatinilytica TaxID=1255257 RepID=A0ABP9S788_9GAMM
MRQRNVWLIAGLWALLTAGVAAAPEDRPPFFKLSYQGNHAWLLGSIHVGRADFYPMAEPIEAAMSKAEVLVLEADPNDPEATALVMQNMLATSPLPADLAERLESFCQRHRLQCDPRLRPWLLGSQIAIGMMGQAGYLPQYGVEQQLLKRFAGRPLVELEGMAYQLEVFNSFSDKAAQAMLRAAVETSDFDDIEALIGAWRQGDQQTLAAQMSEGLSADPELFDKLMLKRNSAMSTRLVELLAKQDRLFVAVGAGHLVGEGAIPEALAEAGVSVTDCWQADCGL